MPEMAQQQVGDRSTAEEVSEAIAHWGSLLPALRRLDRVLEQAVNSTASRDRTETTDSPFRGLYLRQADVERLLSLDPAVPAFGADRAELGEAQASQTSKDSPLHWLERRFELSPFDLDLILIALAPEIDLRYERAYSYLQDDVTRRRPSVELALNLLCSTAEEKLARRTHFDSQAPLLRHRLLHVLPDSNQVDPPFLAHYLKVDEQIVRVLLGQPGPDPRLAAFCELVQPAAKPKPLPLSTETERILLTLITQARKLHQPLRLYFRGERNTGKRSAAEALAGAVSAPMLAAEFNRIAELRRDFSSLLKVLFREAEWRGALLYLTGLEILRHEERGVPQQLMLEALAGHSGITILAGAEPWLPAGVASLSVISVPFATPGFGERRACWAERLADEGFALDENELQMLAGRFQLTAGQIAEVVASATQRAHWRAVRTLEVTAESAPVKAVPSLGDLYACARAQCGHDLAKLARKIDPKYAWDDIVLPPDQLAQLKEICDQVKYGPFLYREWGFDRKLSLGKGVNVLFSGPPGTGKTMAAEVLASELCLDLYKIDLSQVVSKYIGETEKNLDRVFTAAENSNAILFFDEADALFGKRSEVKDAHDRYANIEIGYLLQKMEEYEGIAILATNLRQNLDEAFVRRMRAIVEFPFPDEEYRRQIWQSIFPREAPLGDDVDVVVLGRELKLTGANIRNIALAAAFYAAADGRVINMSHLARAARREYQKLGRTWTETDWIGTATLSSQSPG